MGESCLLDRFVGEDPGYANYENGGCASWGVELVRVVTAKQLASRIGAEEQTLRKWLRERFPTHVRGTRWLLTEVEADTRAHEFAAEREMAFDRSDRAPSRKVGKSKGRDQSYVLDLCDIVLGERCSREHRFDWLRGDPDEHGRRRRLPVDGFYVLRGLVVEYHERQHSGSVPFFDKPDEETVSGVHRGKQRRLYDLRRVEEIPAHGFRLVVIDFTDLTANAAGRLVRDDVSDRVAIARLLEPS